MTREIRYAEAILEATDQCMVQDSRVYVIGLGVTDPKGIFGTTLGLEAKYGARRVMDMPASENAMTGVAIGSTLVGLRPIMTHQRADFALLTLDQIINNASKWHYMFGAIGGVPLVIRLVIGRGWGQGPQHSQSIQALFAHIPGLKVVMPATPHDAKGMLVAAVEDDNPVIFFEHRWLHNISGSVPEELYREPIGRSRVMREGKDVTIVATSHMVLESMRASEALTRDGIEAEIVDVRTIRPLDTGCILGSVEKTGRLIVADDDWRTLGFGAEVLAIVAEELFGGLKCPPRRIAYPDAYTPTSPSMANNYYPRVVDIVNTAREMMGLPQKSEDELGIRREGPLDIPDNSFTGPF
ncbi:MAG: transketolase C-terminal domain-containing protein [Nitrospinota bacterium]|jgi:pyruvate dehydrogenase E1 component beta subunit|nr:transketolase C-terminal domain-containing protein [Nitrospinota bacterium]MDP7168026.1 transketolase C-terminal domain-containing protein [Nitrospinota bacterium]MDP7371163.1 transketolase C-terminal domain-containing protein [Nitrospinota bacterium]MDP7503422.1 transketolase C-terminal domain-containing protein [Nitrospinota bacterium]MDP7662218.1 transketolase C-terminal domain-containing protein [Nitrospinota bacterium]